MNLAKKLDDAQLGIDHHETISFLDAKKSRMLVHSMRDTLRRTDWNRLLKLGKDRRAPQPNNHKFQLHLQDRQHIKLEVPLTLTYASMLSRNYSSRTCLKINCQEVWQDN
jgi:hypothetical protein